MYSELDFILLAESIRDVHLQGLIREVYGISVDCLKEWFHQQMQQRRVIVTENATTKGGKIQDNYDNERVIKSEAEEEGILKNTMARKRNAINTFLGGTLFNMSVVSHIPSCNIFRILEGARCIRGSGLCE